MPNKTYLIHCRRMWYNFVFQNNNIWSAPLRYVNHRVTRRDPRLLTQWAFDKLNSREDRRRSMPNALFHISHFSDLARAQLISSICELVTTEELYVKHLQKVPYAQSSLCRIGFVQPTLCGLLVESLSAINTNADFQYWVWRNGYVYGSTKFWKRKPVTQPLYGMRYRIRAQFLAEV